MLKAKKLTIILTFFVLISLFGTTFVPMSAFAESETQSSADAEPAPEPVPQPSVSDEINGDLPQYNLYDTDKLYSEGVFMVNLNTNIVVCSKNPDERMIPASLTKIMTALVCFENVTDFKKIVECPYACFDEFWGDNPNYRGASTAGFDTKQENLTYLDCLYGLMLPSGCEAANIIAYNVAGDIPTFVDMMNETAKKLGCTNTHFTNAHGLYDKDNYTSARDLYLITRYALDTYPGFKEICEATSYDMPANKTNPKGYTVTPTNKMMKTSSPYYYEGVKGVKTGSIYEYEEFNGTKWEKVDSRGVRTLVTTCTKGDYAYLLVTLGAPYYDENGKVPEQEYPYVDHKALYDWAYSEFEYSRVIGKNEYIMSAKVDMGAETDEVGLVTDGEFFTLLPKMEGAESIVQMIKPEVGEMTAPVEQGVFAANLQMVMGNKVVAEIPLVTARYVAIDQGEYYRRKVEEIVSSPIFIAVCAGIVLIVILVIVLNIIARNRKKKNFRSKRKIAVSSSKAGKPTVPKSKK